MTDNTRDKHKEKDRGKKKGPEQPEIVEATVMPPEETPAADEEQSSKDSEDIQKIMTEANDKYLRARAEMDNYRRRVQREFGEIRELAKASTIEEFLPVFDHFQMAMLHINENPDINTLKQGMDMILAEFHRTLESLGATALDATGREFDPNEHEAVAQEPSDSVPAGKVLRQWKCGYRIGERLLRPATVVVSSGPAKDGDNIKTETEKVEK